MAMMRQRMSPDYAQARPYPLQNEMDRQAAQAASGRMSGPPAAPMTAGMSSPSVPTSLGAPQERNAMGLTPQQMRQMSYDPSADQGRVDSQRAYAQSLRGKDAPQGREVGPLGVYMAPNWGESLQYAGEQVLGGLAQRKANEQSDEISRKTGLAKAAEATAAAADVQRDVEDTEWEKRYKYKQLEEQVRAAKASEEAAERGLDLEAQGLALDAIEMDPIQYLRDDGSKLYVGYRLNEDNTAVEPYNLDTGKKVNMGELMFDPSSVNDGKSFNEPMRFVDAKTNDEKMLSWNKGGYYVDAFTGARVEEDELHGWIPEAAMSEKQREDQIIDWVKNNGDTLELLHDIQAANVAFARANPEGGGSPEGVFNWFTKQSGPAGDVFRLIDDIGEDGSPTADAYAAGNTVFNAISRIRAGLSQTVSEVERIEAEIGRPLFISPEVLVKYWDRLGEKVIADLTRAEETMSPRTMQALNRWRTQKSEQGLTSGLISGQEARTTRSGRGIGGAQGGGAAPAGTTITGGTYKGMTKGNDGKIYDENGVAVARWR